MAQLGLAPIVLDTAAHLVAIGELTVGTVAAVEQAVNELLDEGVTELTIDLRKVTSLEDEVVDVLVAIAGKACARKVPVRLCADAETRQLLEAAKATALFAAIDEALAKAESLRSLLDVCAGGEVPEPAAVTWVSTP